MARRKNSSDCSQLSTLPHKIHPHLKENACYCIVKIAMRLRARLDERLAPFQLISPQYAMLRLVNLEGAMTQVELGSYMAMDKATMVRMIDALEQRDYLRRTQSLTDRRAKLLELTTSGRKLLKKIDGLRDAVEEEFFAPLTPKEKATLRDIVSRLLS